MAKKDSTLDLMRQWTDINQNLWNTWLNSTKHLSKGPAGMDEAYHQHLKGMEKVVDDTMRLERDWVQLAKQQSGQNQALEPAVKFMTDMAETALETRGRMWRAMFENAQTVDLSTPANALGAAQGPQDFLASMQQCAERLLGTQAQAAKASTKGAAETTEEAAGSGTQSSSQARTG